MFINTHLQIKCLWIKSKRAQYSLKRAIHSLKGALYSLKSALYSLKRALHSLKRALYSQTSTRKWSFYKYNEKEPSILSNEPYTLLRNTTCKDGPFRIIMVTKIQLAKQKSWYYASWYSLRSEVNPECMKNGESTNFQSRHPKLPRND